MPLAFETLPDYQLPSLERLCINGQDFDAETYRFAGNDHFTSRNCAVCSKTFTGRPQHVRFNLQRHFRTSPTCHQIAGRRCPQPECRHKLLMRFENLVPHLQNFHKMSLSSVIQLLIETSVKRRSIADCAESRTAGLEDTPQAILADLFEVPNRIYAGLRITMRYAIQPHDMKIYESHFQIN